MKLQKRLSSIVLNFENLTCMNFYHLHCKNRGKIFQRDAQFWETFEQHHSNGTTYEARGKRKYAKKER